MRRYSYDYAHSRSAQIGCMVCSACHMSIINSQFRYRETKDAYILQHRTCSAADPHWHAMDVAEEAAKARRAALHEAAKAFRDKWGVHDLNELIAETESNL
jgi:hypothetical protein